MKIIEKENKCVKKLLSYINRRRLLFPQGNPHVNRDDVLVINDIVLSLADFYKKNNLRYEEACWFARVYCIYFAMGLYDRMDWIFDRIYELQDVNQKQIAVEQVKEYIKASTEELVTVMDDLSKINGERAGLIGLRNILSEMEEGFTGEAAVIFKSWR